LLDCQYGLFKIILGRRNWYQSKPACDFLFVINSNISHSSHRFRDSVTTVQQSLLNFIDWRGFNLERNKTL